jgi:hypothetical protein
MNQQNLKWKLFPFSLVGGAKKWYYSSVGSMEGSWDKLREKFCLTFFPMSRVVTIRQDILSFKQLYKDSLGTAWARFTNSLASGPDIGIPEPILLEHFRMGLDDESAKFLDTSSRGSFSHFTLSEGRHVLGKILENTPYTGIFDEFPDEEEEEPMPTTLSEPKPIEEKHTFPTIQSIDDCTPLTKTWFTDEPFQPYMEVDNPLCDFVYEFYDELFVDFGNTWNYRRIDRPKAREKPETLVPTSEDRSEHFRLISNLSAIMSREWLDEAEASTVVIKLPTKMSHTRCELMGSKHDVGYEPSLGVSIISSSLAKSLVAASSLSRSSRLLNIPSEETLGCQGVLRVCPIKYVEHELYLDFHLFDLPCHHTHSTIIDRPIMKILEQSPRRP